MKKVEISVLSIEKTVRENKGKTIKAEETGKLQKVK